MAKAYRKKDAFIWVKDEKGDTYMCPISAVKDPKNPTKEELKHCRDESRNPQND